MYVGTGFSQEARWGTDAWARMSVLRIYKLRGRQVQQGTNNQNKLALTLCVLGSLTHTHAYAHTHIRAHTHAHTRAHTHTHAHTQYTETLSQMYSVLTHAHADTCTPTQAHMYNDTCKTKNTCSAHTE